MCRAALKRLSTFETGSVEQALLACDPGRRVESY
jgi:hypothetical protein